MTRASLFIINSFYKVWYRFIIIEINLKDEIICVLYYYTNFKEEINANIKKYLLHFWNMIRQIREIKHFKLFKDKWKDIRIIEIKLITYKLF